MATATQFATPSRDDFAQMLEESFTQGSPQEGAVVKGIVVGIEKDLAVIDVGSDGLHLAELAPGVTAEEVCEKTEPALTVDTRSPELSV